MPSLCSNLTSIMRPSKLILTLLFNTVICPPQPSIPNPPTVFYFFFLLTALNNLENLLIYYVYCLLSVFPTCMEDPCLFYTIRYSKCLNGTWHIVGALLIFVEELNGKRIGKDFFFLLRTGCASSIWGLVFSHLFKVLNHYLLKCSSAPSTPFYPPGTPVRIR